MSSSETSTSETAEPSAAVAEATAPEPTTTSSPAPEPTTPASPAPAKPAPAKSNDVATTGVAEARPPMAAHSLARILLGVTGLVWMAIGLWGLADPTTLADVVDLRVESDLGRLEVRAMYGGFCVAIGVLHGLAASRRAWLMQGLVSALILTVGLLSGRLLSVAIEGVPGPTGLLLIGAETSLIAVLSVGIWRLMMANRAARKALKKAQKAVA